MCAKYASCLYVSIFEASQQQLGAKCDMLSLYQGLVPWACDGSSEHTLAAGPKGHHFCRSRNWWILGGISMVHGGWMGGNPSGKELLMLWADYYVRS